MRSLFLLSATLAALAQATDATWWIKRNYDTVSKIYDQTVYPKNQAVLDHGAAAVPPGLFNEKARGRVSPIGNFSSFDDAIEYFFALAPTPDTNPAGQGFHQATVVEFSSECPEIAASTVYLKAVKMEKGTGKILNNTETILKQVGFWRFDDKGAVLEFDAWIPNLGAWVFEDQGKLNYSNPFIQKAAVAIALCPGIQQRCTGPNAQFNSSVSCVAELTPKPFGQFDEAWGDTIACRIIHLILTKVRPKVHCPHTGKAGGNNPDNWKCTNINYREEYFNDAALFQNKQFICPGTKKLLGIE